MFAARALAVASLALFAQVASAAKCTRTYTVQAGDYCDKISAANNASTYQLGANNPGVINERCDNLVIGGQVCLGTEGEDCAETYVVTAGNTCDQIWTNHGINSTIFSFNNPQVNADCTNIYVGEVLCVAKEVLVPPVPGVPIHTAPPAAAETLANPTAAATAKPPTDTSAPPVAKPPATPAAAAAPAITSAPATDDDLEDCDEWEVVEGPTDEDLPFCDEVL